MAGCNINDPHGKREIHICSSSSNYLKGEWLVLAGYMFHTLLYWTRSLQQFAAATDGSSGTEALHSTCIVRQTFHKPERLSTE